jgi:predicted transposase/invertase (TIGR01784 family)
MEQKFDEGVKVGEEKGIKIGEEKGIKIGEKQGKAKIITKMYQNGMGIDAIAEATDLSEDKVKQLLRQVQ